MSDSNDNDLYQEVILDHYKNPRNYCELADATSSAQGHNPLCGDQIKVYLKIKDGIIEQISFAGSGCAISKASGSMMTEQLKGRTIAEAVELFENVIKMLTGRAPEEVDQAELGKLAALSGVCAFPMRVKCATLAWHTLRAAMTNKEDEVSTE